MKLAHRPVHQLYENKVFISFFLLVVVTAAFIVVLLSFLWCGVFRGAIFAMMFRPLFRV
jgi:small basic protein